MIIRHGWDNASISDCASAGFQIHTFTFLILSFIFFLALKKINHFKESLKIIPYTLEFLDKVNSVFLPLKWRHILLFYTQLKLARFKILKLCMEWNCKQWNLCMGPVGSYTGFCWICYRELHPKNKCSLKTRDQQWSTNKTVWSLICISVYRHACLSLYAQTHMETDDITFPLISSSHFFKNLSEIYCRLHLGYSVHSASESLTMQDRASYNLVYR